MAPRGVTLSTVIPQFLAVPSTTISHRSIDISAVQIRQLDGGNLPKLRLGHASDVLGCLAFRTPSALRRLCFSSTDAGGVFRMNVKLLSSNTVISTGMMVPILSWVAALYSLHKTP